MIAAFSIEIESFGRLWLFHDVTSAECERRSSGSLATRFRGDCFVLVHAVSDQNIKNALSYSLYFINVLEAVLVCNKLVDNLLSYIT